MSRPPLSAVLLHSLLLPAIAVAATACGREPAAPAKGREAGPPISLGPAPASSREPRPAGGLPPGHPPLPVAGEPAPVPAAPPPAAHGGFDAARMTWKQPEGWTKGPDRPVRLVTFLPEGRAGVECSITVLGGDGGGMAENVNRWRSQLRLAPLGAGDLAALPTTPVLGGDARLIEIDGGAAGMLVAVRELGTHTVFVKMTGAPADLKAERERFLGFCRSLTVP